MAIILMAVQCEGCVLMRMGNEKFRLILHLMTILSFILLQYNLFLCGCLSLFACDVAASKIFIIPAPSCTCAYDNKVNLTITDCAFFV